MTSTRADLLHNLSGRFSVVLMSVPFCQETLGRLQKYPGLDHFAREEVSEVLRALDDMSLSCAGAGAVLDQLRRA